MIWIKKIWSCLPDKQSCVLRRSQNFLRFGDYRFVLEFVKQARDEDRIKVQPSGYHGLHVSPTLGRQYDESRDKGILGILDVWCGHNISPPPSRSANSHQNIDGNICKRTFYSMPLAMNSFYDMPWVEIEFEKRLPLLYQTLVGLAELHQQNSIHGNILPEPLLIFTKPGLMTEGKSPPERAVISLNMRKRKEEPEASICVAPEIWERQSDQNEELDETKLDIWGLAAS